MTKLRTYDGAVVLITGGASGIGLGLAEELARRGAEVVVTDVRADAVLEARAAVARVARGKSPHGEALDVRDRAAVADTVARIYERHGRLDYVFANAGTGIFGEAHLLENRDWDLQVDVNIHGVMNTVQAVYPRFVAQGYGHLVNVASVAGLVASPFISVYVMTKHAVVGLSKSLRIEGARHGVRVSALCPGPIRTPILTGGAQGRSVYPKLVAERILAWWKRYGGITELAPFVRETVDAVARNEGLIVLPRKTLPLVRLANLFPQLAEKAGKKIYRDTLRDWPEIGER